MTPRLARIAATLAVMAGACAVALAFRWQPPAPIATTERSSPVAAPARRFRVAALDSLARLTIARAPFRVSRAPSDVRYDPAVDESRSAPPPRARPSLTLTGIASGAPPQAVIEGLPGVDGARVMQPGDTAAGVRIVRIAPAGVVVAGFDTTWTLTVRTEWP